MEAIAITTIGITVSKLKSCIKLCKKIYNSARMAKHNEDRCFEIAQRCRLLEKNINDIKDIVDNDSLDIALEILFVKLKKAETVIEIYSNKGFFGKVKNTKHFEKECIEIFKNIDESVIDINLTLGTESLKKQKLIIDNQEYIINNQGLIQNDNKNILANQNLMQNDHKGIIRKQNLMNTRQSLMKDKQDIILNKQDIILNKIEKPESESEIKYKIKESETDMECWINNIYKDVLHEIKVKKGDPCMASNTLKFLSYDKINFNKTIEILYGYGYYKNEERYLNLKNKLYGVEPGLKRKDNVYSIVLRELQSQHPDTIYNTDFDIIKCNCRIHSSTISPFIFNFVKKFNNIQIPHTMNINTFNNFKKIILKLKRMKELTKNKNLPIPKEVREIQTEIADILVLNNNKLIDYIRRKDIFQINLKFYIDIISQLLYSGNNYLFHPNIKFRNNKDYDDILFQSLEHILNKPEINELLNFINENEIFLNIECNCIEKNNIKNKLCKLRKEDCTIHKSPNFYGTHLAYQEYLKIVSEIDKHNNEYATKWLLKNLVRYTINWRNELIKRYDIKCSFDEFELWKEKIQKMSLPELKKENLRLRKEIEYYSNTSFDEYKKWVEFDKFDNGSDHVKNISLKYGQQVHHLIGYGKSKKTSKRKY